MNTSSFVYVTFIRTTPQKLWHALVDKKNKDPFTGGFYQDFRWS